MIRIVVNFVDHNRPEICFGIGMDLCRDRYPNVDNIVRLISGIPPGTAIGIKEPHGIDLFPHLVDGNNEFPLIFDGTKTKIQSGEIYLFFTSLYQDFSCNPYIFNVLRLTVMATLANRKITINEKTLRDVRMEYTSVANKLASSGVFGWGITTPNDMEKVIAHLQELFDKASKR